MAIIRIDISTLLTLAPQHPVIDVRSEGEFVHAHFPGAVSMPLFNNEERKIIGMAYKKESKQKAIKIGLQLFGGKMVGIVEAVEKLLEDTKKETEQSPSKTVVVYCWRGGMRSGGFAWLLDLYGFKVYTIAGGYKAFRRWSIQQLEKDYPLKLVGGYTGSGKTIALQEMKKLNHLVIDLENLANHKGSAFGNIGMPTQPSQEMFENLLAMELFKTVDRNRFDSCQLTDGREVDSCQLTDDIKTVNHQLTPPSPLSTVNNQLSTCIWIEDESQRIGLVNLPTVFYRMMRSKLVYFLDIPFEERLKHIVAEYGKSGKDELVKAILRIQKRLGGLETKNAIDYLFQNKLADSFRILLKYYDKQYLKSLHSREHLDDQVHKLECETVDTAEIAHRIINK